ncbi:GNAT family N-acetyltransferase [Streptacidiphilus jiangxiensis]|uniref:Acetyltransferase (GNAT) family protein n=1 Tax=Streptacidiphilus jiangxiensis TaxID=235985 RepID=A0A1H7FRF0_STRJI|nr:GNAT family N-acetyltransferase [Streptacidiphilus jiangxiensis]SEK28539.1 Acetyltransferase (GNAT) family protein [Streptacidiphilus jiangxiensis]
MITSRAGAVDRSAFRLTPADLGRRVMTRRVVGVVDDRLQFGDTLGVLTSWDPDTDVLTVVNRAGEAVELPVAELVAGKPVPPAPLRRSLAAPEPPTAAELQRIAARGWNALEQEALGGWVLRASSGFTRRGNSTQTLGDPGLPLDEALDRVQAWYTARGLPAFVELTSPGSTPGLEAALATRGAQEAGTFVRTAPLARLAAPVSAPAADVRLARVADEAWLARYQRVGADAVKTAAARELLHSGASVWFASVSLPDVPDGPAAIGRCVVDGAWAGFAAIEVAPQARRRGLASAVMATLASRAAEEGACGAYLQVEEVNTAAGALYDRLGFDVAYRYAYARLAD